MYDALLTPGNAPTWPLKLREIEMVNLRKWSPEAAVEFFESLCNTANELTDLRRLVIKAMLNIGWRGMSGSQVSLNVSAC